MKDFCPGNHGKIHLKDWDPQDSRAFKAGKENAEKEVDALTKRLAELQTILYAEQQHKILVLLQAMDTAGKDGTIRRVFDEVNPQGVRVANFKQPTGVELSHDFLWRIHQQAPANGEIVIFNRSHYEDVLITRVHKLVPKEVWKKRYQHINHFERMLTDEGTTILKFFLHISKDEQKERLDARLKDPHKRWKFRETDLKERKFWKEYQKAYEEAIQNTSTDWAPWHIIPSDKKWFRNWAVAKIIVSQLESLKPKYPAISVDHKIKVV